MGYPSDHFLLIVEVRAKLKAKPRQPPAYNRFAVPEEYQVALYRSLIAEKPISAICPDPVPPADQHTYTFYSDGSGTKGKCSSAAPAGWGWTLEDDDDSVWLDSCGPIVTNSDHNAFVGAKRGSNDTDELSTIYEALLFAE